MIQQVANKPAQNLAFEGLRKPKAANQPAFEGKALKADTVSFGNGAAIAEGVTQAAPSIITRIKGLAMKAVGLVTGLFKKDGFVRKAISTIIEFAKKLNPLNLIKGKGAEAAQEVAKAVT